MDSALFSLPEIILSDMEEPGYAQSGSLPSCYFSPHDLQLVQESDVHKLTGDLLQNQRVGQFAPSEPRPATPKSSSKTRAKPRRTANRQTQMHRTLSSKGPFQTRDQDRPPFRNLLPGDCLPSLGLQASHSGDGFHPGLAPLFPELMLGPCFPHDLYWPDVSPVTSTPNSKMGLGPHALGPHVLVPHVLVPHVLVPIGSPLCCSPCSGPPSLLLLPEVRPDWCMCPQEVHQHRPDPDSRGTTGQLGGQAEPEVQRSRVYRKDQAEEEQNINNLDGTTVSPSLDDELQPQRNFEEYMRIINSLSLKAGENGDEDEEEEEELALGNVSFLEFMDELCSDEHFVSKVESTLNAEFLDYLLCADPEPVDLLAREPEVESTPNAERLDPPPSPDPIDLLSHRELLLEILNVIQQQLADLSPETEGTAPATSRVEEPAPLRSARAPVSDPPGSECDAGPNQDGRHLLEAQTGSPVGASTSPLDGWPFEDFIAFLQLHAITSPDAGPTRAPEARDGGTSAEETPAAAKPEKDWMSLSSLGDTQSAQAPQRPQEGPLPGGPPAPESPSSVSGANEDLKTHPRPLPLTREPLEPRSPENSNSCPEATPEPSHEDSFDPPADVLSSDSASSDPDVSRETGSAPSTKIPQEKSEPGEGPQTSRSTAAEGRGRSSPKTEVQDDAALEVEVREEEAGRPTPTVLSPMKRSGNRREKTSEDEEPLAAADTRSTKDSTKESSAEEPPVGARESLSAPTPERQRRRPTAAGSGAESKRGDVSGTCDFYRLRTRSASRGTGATPQPVEAGHRRPNGTETISSSPAKRGRSQRGKSNVEAKATPGCERRPPSTRSSVKPKDGKASKARRERVAAHVGSPRSIKTSSCAKRRRTAGRRRREED